MADSGRDDDLGLAEDLAEPPDAVASGSVVGKVVGLIWCDISGVDVVSVAVQDEHIAVPVESDSWRDVHVVELKTSAATLTDAPRVQDLKATGGMRAVELVSNHFSMPLSGPPPGPSTGPLPPWWPTKEPGGVQQGDDPTPLIG
jgi:hypothetical protein